MNKISVLIAVALAAPAALVALPSTASAQGYQPAQPAYNPGQRAPRVGYYRRGLTLGVDLGFGGMNSEAGDIRCTGCNVEPIAVGVGFHVGGMLNPRMAIQFEGSFTGRPLDQDGFEILYQSTALGVVKYWLMPRLWIKGGLGFAALGITYEDEFGAVDDQLDEGLAGMAAIGFEVLWSPKFAIDLSLRGESASYDGIGDTINSGTFRVGVSWY